MILYVSDLHIQMASTKWCI